MSYSLNFSKRYKYDSRENGITLEVQLTHNNLIVDADAKVDTGAQVCLFARELGEKLELQIESGVPIQLATLAGSMMAYGHEITLETIGLSFQTVIYFSEFENLPRNLLGRQGWLQLVRLGIIDYDEEIYLSPYNK